MQRITGIITEYNPFHNGHLYQIQQIKKQFPDAPLVIAMSGNFLQRGEPAIIDKWHRAAECLSNDADLVMELPLMAAVQPADRFAYYGVWTLAQMGVTDLFFGAEHATFDFMHDAQKAMEITGNFNKYHESFAKTYQQVIAEKVGHQVDQPNDLLGLAYAKANLKLKAGINLHPIQRKNANYHDIELNDAGTIASASAIREALHHQNQDFEKFVPHQTAQDLKKQPLVSWDDFWIHLKMELLTHSPQELEKIYGMAEGIQYRMIAMAQRSEFAGSFDSWIKAVKNKRFTYTRLSRLATMTLLHITWDDVASFEAQPYLRVLGFSKKGQAVLHAAKKSCDHPIITNVSQDEKKGILRIDYRAGKVYQAVCGNEQDLKHAPIMTVK
ncbi:nucleotidyltransferase [Ligilactobacillus aviarius]|uniref:nucleotidyltransferase n=1 Tax=Ligilactobacillus aviarius TaxID=1606 RepID=UPI00249EFE07|nr:nucleotidyltransferase [Ligilactobacillus aviarius]